MIAPLEIRVSPIGYGGTELIVSLLTEELVMRGHEITLFASGDSISQARLQAVCPHFLRDSKRDKGILNLLNVVACLQRAFSFSFQWVHQVRFAYSAGRTGSIIHRSVLAMY